MYVVYIHFMFFFNDTATTEIYTYWHTLSLHDALPIYAGANRKVFGAGGGGATHTVSVTDISDSGAVPGPVGGSSTATVTGGVGPFTYLWQWTGSDQAGVALSGETTATATVSWSSDIDRKSTRLKSRH